LGAYIEVWTSSVPEAMPLAADRVTIGSDDGNDVTLGADPTASRLHAAFERFGSGWCVTDLGSRNGTLVNGERILGPRALHHGDEILVGGTRLVFRDEARRSERPTLMGERPPELTAREHDVLLALCRPLLSGELLTGPASVKQIAAELVLTEDGVKKHLRRLYEKFHIEERPARGRLANEAIRRGAVSLGDLRARADPS
jgi:pSer/pThr/pTyr-binding forkhead associated (FHA) protein